MTASPTELPERFGRYRIEALVGQGGMGRVYRAYDTLLRRRVALKVLRADRAGAPAAELLREARAAAALRHPNIVTVYDAGEVGGTHFLAMEWLDGATLRAFIGDARVPLSLRLRWLSEIAAALAAAHAAGLVHRDVKPDNVLVGADRVARVVDFGLARSSDDETGATTRDAAIPEGRGRVAGTPRYMAPEQRAGAPLTAAADQYAWGVVAYELCGGIHPADAARAASIEDGARQGSPPLDALNPEVPAAVAALVLQALETSPLARLADMTAIARALAPWARPGEAAAGGQAAAAASGEVTVRERPDRGAPNTEGTVSTGHGLARTARVAPPGARRARRIAGLALGAVMLAALGTAVLVVVGRTGSRPAAAAATSAPPPPPTTAALAAPTAPVGAPVVSSAPASTTSTPPAVASSRALRPVSTAPRPPATGSARALGPPDRGPMETEL